MKTGNYLKLVKEKAPVVHHLTNWVTIYDCANIVKVFGASPVMAHSIDEVEDMVLIASALVLNIGTLTEEFVQAMKKAAAGANRKGIPVILDVCGAGATPLRNRKCAELIEETEINVIKGNASEIASVAGVDVRTRGVDSTEVKEDITEIAAGLADRKRCVVAVTGKTDTVVSEKEIFKVLNGHAMMAGIVGTGCMAASVIGTFCAVSKDTAEAAAAGLACYEIAAENAALRSAGPGSFKENLFDEIFKLDEKNADERSRIECSSR